MILYVLMVYNTLHHAMLDVLSLLLTIMLLEQRYVMYIYKYIYIFADIDEIL